MSALQSNNPLNMSHFWTIIFSTKSSDNIVFAIIVVVVNIIYIRVFCITINVNISHRSYCCLVNQRYRRYRCRSCRDRYRSCHVNINHDIDIALIISLVYLVPLQSSLSRSSS